MLGSNNDFAPGSVLDVDSKLSVTGTLADPGTVSLLGSLTTGGSGDVQVGTVTLTGGSLRVSAGSIVNVAGGTGGIAGAVTVAEGYGISGYGELLGGPIIDNGNITANGGTLLLGAAVSGSGSLTIDPGASVSVLHNLGVAVDFAAGKGETMVVAKGASVTGTISGFADGDTINVRGLVASTLSFAGGDLMLESGKTDKVVGILHLAGDYNAADFALSADPVAGIDITYAGAAPAVSGAASALFHDPTEHVDLFGGHWHV